MVVSAVTKGAQSLGVPFPIIRRALLRSILAIFACLACAASPRSVRAQANLRPTIATIAISETDRGIVDTVEKLGFAVTRRQLAAGTTDVDLLLWARTLSEPMILWVDSRTSTVTVLRASDGTSLSRVLGQQTFTESPYVAALAASELLELMGHTPAAQVETAPVVPEPAPSALTWLGSLGGELAAGARRGPALLRPQLSVGASFAVNERLFLYGELCALPYGVAAESLPDESGGRLLYRRADLMLRLGAGREQGRASVLGYLSPGVGFLRVTSDGVDGDRSRVRRRRQISAGGGVMFRYWLSNYLGLAFGVDVAWLTSPARYLVDGRLALKEDSLRIGASLSLLARIR